MLISGERMIRKCGRSSIEVVLEWLGAYRNLFDEFRALDSKGHARSQPASKNDREKNHPHGSYRFHGAPFNSTTFPSGSFK
jgi:hypothetical protein